MNDLIDRQSVLNAFDYWVKSPMIGYTNGLVRLREMFEELPPVTQEPCEDAISREDALMALTGEYTESPIEILPKAIRRIKTLPPVNPAEKVGHWIPVSERLPKGSDIVLLSLPPHIDPDGEECFASVICGHYIGGRNAEWGLSDGDAFGYGLVSVRKGTNPVAWMPLPEPYKASPTGVESEGV